MKKKVIKENYIYLAINIIITVLCIVNVILSCSILSNTGDFRLLCRVVSRGVFGLLIIYNSIYLLFTSKWSFLCLNSTPKRRIIYGIILGLTGLMGLVTAILGYGINGDPRLIWWR